MKSLSSHLACDKRSCTWTNCIIYSSRSTSSRSVQRAWVSYYYSSSNTLHFFSLSHPIYCDARTTLALPVVQLRSRVIKRTPFSHPHYGTCPHFYLENNSASCCRIVPTHAAWRFQQLVDPFLLVNLCIYLKSTKLTTRWLFNSRTNAIHSINSVTPLDHRGDRPYTTHCSGGVSGYLRALYRSISSAIDVYIFVGLVLVH